MNEDQVRSMGERLIAALQRDKERARGEIQVREPAILRERQEELKLEGAGKRRAFEEMRERLSLLPGLALRDGAESSLASSASKTPAGGRACFSKA